MAHGSAVILEFGFGGAYPHRIQFEQIAQLNSRNCPMKPLIRRGWISDMREAGEGVDVASDDGVAGSAGSPGWS